MACARGWASSVPSLIVCVETGSLSSVCLLLWDFNSFFFQKYQTQRLKGVIECREKKPQIIMVRIDLYTLILGLPKIWVEHHSKNQLWIFDSKSLKQLFLTLSFEMAVVWCHHIFFFFKPRLLRFILGSMSERLGGHSLFFHQLSNPFINEDNT